MKKLVSLIILSMLLLSGLSIQTLASDEEQRFERISESISFSSATITEERGYASIALEEATSHFGTTGVPSLPVTTKTFTLPWGSSVKSVSVEYEGANTNHLKGTIEPATSPLYTSMELESKNTYDMICDSALYSSSEVYPSEDFGIYVGAGLIGEEEVIYVSISCYPVRYAPAVSELTTYESVEITLDYVLPAEQTVFADDYDFLILTPTEFSSALEKYVEFKESKGIKTKLTTLDEIPQDGIDEQESIKLYIKDMKESSGIDYVLLVGAGLEGEEIFPVRNAWIASGSYENHFPSDLYYADLYDAHGNLSTWDLDGDGRYAELDQDTAAVDGYPDVYIGRWACTDVSQVNIVVSKSMRYTNKNKMTGKILQLGGDTFPDDPTEVCEGELNNQAVLDVLPGYEANQLWATTEKLTKTRAILGAYGNVDFIDISGHGSPQTWATHAPQDDTKWLPEETIYSPYHGILYIDTWWMFNFYKYPVAVLDACSCNKFSATTSCLGWTLVKNPFGGSIASFGASGIGYGSYGYAQPTRLFGWFEVNLFKNMAEDKVLGQAWGGSLTEYINLFAPDLSDADYKTIHEMTLLGDPTLVIDDA